MTVLGTVNVCQEGEGELVYECDNVCESSVQVIVAVWQLTFKLA